MKSLPALLSIILWVTACSIPPTPSQTTHSIEPTQVSIRQPGSTLASSPTASPTPTNLPPTATAIPTPALCSPLSEITLEELPDLVSNPYHPPAPGSDDPHHGVDLSVILPNSTVAISGHPIQTALAGRVAAVIADRFPYGNALLVETPLTPAPAGWCELAQIPTPAPTLQNTSALTCPTDWQPSEQVPNQRSLYILYAHLLQPVQLSPGDAVACGQVIGAVGNSGNALNPHLHFETRVGPSGLRFASMAHYDNSATSAEMSAYCAWRISGLFQLVDPLKILALGSVQ